MAKKVETTVTLVDDVDGSKADRTVTFAFDGKSYEIDLSKKNANAFEKALAPYITAGRRVTRGRGRRATAGTVRGGSRRDDLVAVRAWAKANGHEVSERGRIARSVQDAYDQAH